MQAMGRIVALVNQKGGVGKTTVTLGLASAALVAGHHVLVVDLDPQGAATWALGHDPTDVEISTAEVINRASARAAVLESGWADTVDVLPASPRLLSKDHAAGKEPEGRLRTALGEIADDYDIVLIDCPPSLGNLTKNALTAAQHVVVVVEPAALGLRGVDAVADLIDDIWDSSNPDLDLAGVIVNKQPPVSAEADRQYEELSRSVGKRSVWHPAIPQRVVVTQAVAERSPIHGYGRRAAGVTDAFDQLWAKLRRLTK
jgi:cellulose biosynthesis protein BcsQ